MQIEDIKSVKFLNNILYIAGKSGENNNSINIWDLRNAKLLYEGEKNQEILSLGVLNENIYYSRKTNNVCGCEYEKNKIKIFNPPHTNTITSVISYGETIISASRDRSIKQ